MMHNFSSRLLEIGGVAVEWRVAHGLIGYEEAVALMEARAADVANGNARELVWLLEHPPIYTAGTSARAVDLLQPNRFPVYETGRGGQFTYHGPGQRVVYAVLDVRRRARPIGQEQSGQTGDVRRFVAMLEAWVIAALAEFNVRGETRADRVGVWVRRPEKGLDVEDKIAAIGIRIRRWVSFHGLSINVEPDLEHFSGIVPCGISRHGVTSLVDLGLPVTMHDVDVALERAFVDVAGGGQQGAVLDAIVTARSS